MQAVTDNLLLKLPDFMASSNGRKNESQRPRPIHVSKSFSRLPPTSPDSSTRSTRANTIQNGVISEGVMSDKTNTREGKKPKVQPETFEKSPQEDGEPDAADQVVGKLSADFDELPIELVSLADRCVLFRHLTCLYTDY